MKDENIVQEIICVLFTLVSIGGMIFTLVL